MSGGSSTRVSTTETGPWKEQQGYLLGGFEQARNLYNRGVPQYYPGESVAGFSPLQRMSQQAITGYATGPRVAGMQAGAEGALMRSLGGATGFTPEQSDDLLAGNVRLGEGTPFNAVSNALSDSVISNLQQRILPGIRDQQIMYQPGGSSRGDLIQNQAITNAVQSGLTQPMAQMYANAYDRAQQMRLPTANLGVQQQQFGQSAYPSIMSAPLGLYDATMSIGDRQQALRQAQIGADQQRYAYQSEAPYNALNQYLNSISGNYGSSSISTTPGPSGLQTLGQIASIAGPIIGAVGSDIRIKENIVPEGAKWQGFNVYTYNYIGDSTPRRGVMAQEVELTRPDAVSEVDGIKHVNYGALV